MTGADPHFSALPYSISALIAIAGRLLLLRAARTRDHARLQWATRLEAKPASDVILFVDNDIETQANPATLRDGHLFRAEPGVLPVDGVVSFGSGFVDEDFAGVGPEQRRMKAAGSIVYAGSRVLNGNLLVRATTAGEHTFSAALAASLRRSYPWRLLLATDAAWVSLGIALGIVFGFPIALPWILAAPGMSWFSLLSARRLAFARAAAANGWLWSEGGAGQLARAGMLVVEAPGVLTEGRPKLAAVETCGRLSEDAALALLGPLARKLESPAALAVLFELRARRIPLQLSELFQPENKGGMALVAGEEVRWISRQSESDFPGPLASFLREHEGAGEEVCLLERNGMLEAAFAFRDAPVTGVREAVERLREAGLPMLLLSAAPKAVVTRFATELGIEHAQGDTKLGQEAKVLERFTAERLNPIWVGKALGSESARIASGVDAGRAELRLPSLALPDLAAALLFTINEWRRSRHACLLMGILHAIIGITFTVLYWRATPGLFVAAIIGLLPVRVAYIFAKAYAVPVEALAL